MESMKITVIGCGNMGGSIARILAKKRPITLCDRNRDRTEVLAGEIGANFIYDVNEAVKDADYVILVIKPKDVKAISREIDKLKGILISTLAGTPMRTLESLFPGSEIVRMMPNLPLQCGEGVIALCAHDVDKERIEALLDDLGEIFWVTESKMEIITVLAGASPAFIYLFIEALIEAGIEMGLKAKEAEKIVLKTIEGSSRLLLESMKTPGELKTAVASPGGVTIAGLVELEKSGFKGVAIKGVLASFKRVKEMAKSREGEVPK